MCRYARDCSECNRPVCPYDDIDDDIQPEEGGWDE